MDRLKVAREITKIAKVLMALSRNSIENALIAKINRDNKTGTGKNVSIMLTGKMADVLNKEEYTLVKVSEMPYDDLLKLADLFNIKAE